MPPIFPIRVVAMVATAMFLIVGGDAAGKILTSQGVAPFTVAWARFSVAAVGLLPFCGMKWHEWRMMLDWRLWLRAALIAGGISLILTALKTEPMANVFAGFFVGPVVSYFLSAWVLRERISGVRSALLAISFAGVLIVVRPGFGMSPGLIFAVLAGCLHGCYLVATRWLAPSFRPRFLLLSQLIIGSVLLLPLVWGAEAVPLTGASVGLLAISAAGSAAGNLLLVTVNRTTPAGVVAPLIYSQLLAAAAYGYLIFGDVPDAARILGIAIIVGAGASSVWFAGRGR